jgi:hypothetical protein
LLSWTEAASAYSLVRALAVKHRVGFFNVSAENGEIWFPPTEHASDITAIPGPTLTLEGQPDFSSPSAALIEAAVDWPIHRVDRATSSWSTAMEATRKSGVAKRVALSSDASIRTMIFAIGSRDFLVATLRRISPPWGSHAFLDKGERAAFERKRQSQTAFAADKSRPGDFVWRGITAKFASGNPP